MTREEQDRLFGLILKIADAMAKQHRAMSDAVIATSSATAALQDLYAALQANREEASRRQA